MKGGMQEWRMCWPSPNAADCFNQGHLPEKLKRLSGTSHRGEQRGDIILWLLAPSAQGFPLGTLTPLHF